MNLERDINSIAQVLGEAKRLDPGFLQAKIRDVLIGYFEAGYITEADLGSDKAYKKVTNELTQLLLGNEGIGGAVDYREQILGLARDAIHHIGIDFALTFYSMYFEHETNALISCLLRQRDVSHKPDEIMKRGWQEKLTWVIEILGQKPPQADFLACLKIINEDSRNGFVHYKWPLRALSNDKQSRDREKIEDLVEQNVRYFKTYSTRCIYRGRKRIIHEKIDLAVQKFEFITEE
ncbi:MAG TPA: hypothetical protein VGS08_01420 [Candidatus Saccharimonadales bacterium]|nr:hypothetical protein [Candidatus Saccharimonadales bacterium]